MNKHIMKHIRAHFIFGAQTYRETGTHTVPPLVWRGLTQCHHLILRDPDQQSTSFIKYQPLTTPGKGATTPNQSRGESQETAPIRDTQNNRLAASALIVGARVHNGEHGPYRAHPLGIGRDVDPEGEPHLRVWTSCQITHYAPV
jgi:hypothetical protein